MADEEGRLAVEQRRLEGELEGLEEAWEWGRLNGGFDSCTREEQKAKEQKARDVAAVGAELNQLRSLRAEAAQALCYGQERLRAEAAQVAGEAGAVAATPPLS